jgi:hypothetical protein
MRSLNTTSQAWRASSIDQLHTVGDAIAYLRLQHRIVRSADCLRRAARNGRVAVLRTKGGQFLFRAHDLDAFAELIARGDQ